MKKDKGKKKIKTKKEKIGEINIQGIKIDEIHTRYVKKMGSGAIIYFFKEHIGKKVYIIIPKEENKNKGEKKKNKKEK